MTATQGHYTRRNAVEAEGLAQELQAEAAKLLETADLRSVEGIPQEAVVKIFVSQMLSPSKNANIAIQAASRLADMAGMTGKKTTAEDLEAEMLKILGRKATSLRKVVG